MDPSSSTLPIRLDAPCDLMPVVVVARQVGQVGHVDSAMVMLLLVWQVIRVGDSDILLNRPAVLGLRRRCLSLSSEHRRHC